MGLPPARQDSAIRFSFCPFNTINEVNEAAHVIDEQLRLLRKFQKR
jgi:cysteine sulfinate desulfinase/cysteine desulfurase-like protein